MTQRDLACSALLDDIDRADRKGPALQKLLLDKSVADLLDRGQDGWRAAVIEAIRHGVPTPAALAISFYDGYRAEQLPANLLQAQRDYFGALTYERLDRPLGEFFHTEWPERDGRTASRT